MSATSTEEAQELAAQLVCSRYLEPVQVAAHAGTADACRLGLSWSAAQRRESLTHFTFTCSSRQETCP